MWREACIATKGGEALHMDKALQEDIQAVSAACEVSEDMAVELTSLLASAREENRASILWPETRQNAIELDVPSGKGQAWLVLERVYDYTFACVVRRTPSGRRSILKVMWVPPSTPAGEA